MSRAGRACRIAESTGAVTATATQTRAQWRVSGNGLERPRRRQSVNSRPESRRPHDPGVVDGLNDCLQWSRLEAFIRKAVQGSGYVVRDLVLALFDHGRFAERTCTRYFIPPPDAGVLVSCP